MILVTLEPPFMLFSKIISMKLAMKVNQCNAEHLEYLADM